MKMFTGFMRLLSGLAIIGMIFFNYAMAEKIIWVASSYGDLQVDTTFVDVLLENGYEVQVELDSMKGTLTEEQIDVLESGDLVIVSRATGSGDYNDSYGWNSISKPLILNSVYLARNNRWQWINSDELIDDGGCPLLFAENPDHPIFTDVTLDDQDMVSVLDSSVGTGHTSIMNTTDYGEGELIASEESGMIMIVYWDADDVFYYDGDQITAAPRLLFPCQTREGGDYEVGMYNLTTEGEKMYLNAVAFMLGNLSGISQEPSAVPSGYTLEQNYPNPFNPSTRIKFSLTSPSMTKISVYNLLGQEIAVLAKGTFQAGTHEIVWNGCDRFNNPMPTGVYLYQMKTEDRTQSRKMLLLK